MAITELPASPAGEINHNAVRLKVNEIAQAVNGLTASFKRIGEFSTPDPQPLAGSGAANAIKVKVGDGTTTGGEIAVNGTTKINTCNVAGEYILTISVRVQRSGSVGASIIVGRMMYAPDGIEANAVQAGGTYSAEVDDSDTTWREFFFRPATLAAGSIFWFEFARDEAGNNSGDIGANQPTASLAAWSPVASASLDVFVLEVQ